MPERKGKAGAIILLFRPTAEAWEDRTMEREPLVQKKGSERIDSPGQLGEILRVADLPAWLILAAVLVLLIGFFVWASFAYIDSFADGTAQVENGVMTVHFDDESDAIRVTPGMDVTAGGASFPIVSIGRDGDGILFALADTTLADGEYAVRVNYRRTQILKLLFN